jgi:hypothetical protein
MTRHRNSPNERARAASRRFALVAALVLAAGGGCARALISRGEPLPRPPSADLLKPPLPLFEEDGRAGGFAPPAKKQEAPAEPAPAAVSSEPAASAPVVQTAPTAYREPTQASAAAALGTAAPREEGDPLDALFRTYCERLRAAVARAATESFPTIERADLESKLIALFFLRGPRDLEEYRDLIRSFGDDGPVNLELELLKAALYQRVGQPDLRDRALARVAAGAAPTVAALRVTGLSFARQIRGYRDLTRVEPPEFTAGQDLLLYGEIEGFKSAPAGVQRSAASYRRSFAAQLVLRGADGAEIDRRELLRAGQATEVVDDPARPVHFWGRYPLPAKLSPGAYRVEVEAADLESERRARASIGLTVR